MWSEIFKLPKEEIVPLITIGFVVWLIISATIIDSTSVFSNFAGTLMKNIEYPIIFHPLVLILRQFIMFIHSILIIILILLIYPKDNLIYGLLSIPGVLLVFLNLFWMSIVIGFLSARFRDIPPFVGAIMPILFFAPQFYLKWNKLKN